ncbi:MAG: hypothetical protein QGD90_12395, partial [Candidatus Hydrogenedentes bacterium]|nr:hypothetical protein [Candidatus Hydrogenedentota bacterium]
MAVETSISRLDAEHRKQVTKLVVTRLAWLSLLIVTSFFVADLLFAFNDPVRLMMDALLLLLLGATGLWSYGRQRHSTSTKRMIARMLEEGEPEFRNTLINAVDFEENLRTGEHPGTSLDLMKQEIDSASEAVLEFDGGKALRPPTLKKEGYAFLSAVGLATLLAIILSDPFFTILPRFLFPFGDFPPYSPTKLSVTPAGTTADYGEDVKVTVLASGPRPKDLSLVLRGRGAAESTAFPMFDAGDGVYFQTIENVQSDMEYFARMRRGRSKRYQLQVLTAPRIEEVIVTYTYPAYTRLRPQTRLLGDRGLRGYRGTSVEMTLASNRPLAGGDLTVTGEDYALKPYDTHKVGQTFTLSSAGDFSAHVRDVNGNRSAETVAGRVELIRDRKPEVQIVSPGMDSFAVPDAEIPITVEASDDLGLTRLRLYRNHNDSTDAREQIYSGDGSDTYAEVTAVLDLKDLGLRPGDIIDYYATATDSLPDSPQTASTPSFRLLIISFEEYRDYVQTQMTATDLKEKYDAILDELMALAEAQEALHAETRALREIAEEGNALTEEEQERLAKAREQQERLEKLAGELAGRLRKEAAAPAIYDIENEYKEALKEFADRLSQAQGHMDGAGTQMASASQGQGGASGSLGEALSEQKKALEALKRNISEFQAGISQANENLEKVADVIADTELFKYLYTLQKGLERQIRYYKETERPSLDDQIRLKELS